MPILPDSISNIPDSLTVPLHHEVITRLRYCLWIGGTPLPYSEPQDRLKADMMFTWMTTKTFQDLGILMNLYMDVMEQKIVFESQGRRLVQACAVLTTLHMLRKCMHEATLEGGTDIRETSHVLLPRPQGALITAMAMVTLEKMSEYQEVTLWMLYAGAVYERGQKIKDRKRSSRFEEVVAEQAWLTLTLVLHARKVGVSSWEGLREVLRKFVYDQYFGPDGELWFEDALKVDHA